MVNTAKLKSIATVLAALLTLASCSEYLLTPVAVEYDTETTTGSSPETDSASVSDSASSTASSTTTIAPPTDSVDAPTDSDSDTDTYSYTDTADFRHVGYAGANVQDAAGFPNTLTAESTITVTTIEGLIDAIAQKGDAPQIIYVDGELTANESIEPRIVISNVQNLYIIGQNGADITGAGLNIRDSAYILIQNLKIHHVPNTENSENDCISIARSHHVWIDHCEIYNDRDTEKEYDSLLDIIEGSDFITVSWNHFHDNLKGLIVGNSDDDEMAAIDSGKLHVTYHHNIFRNISEGMVSVRFGNAHIFNNYFIHHDVDPTIAISSRMGACVRAELNRFNNVTETLKTDQSGVEAGKIGNMESILNVDEYGDVAPVTPTCELDVDYDYEDTLFSTQLLEGMLDQYAKVDVLD